MDYESLTVGLYNWFRDGDQIRFFGFRPSRNESLLSATLAIFQNFRVFGVLRIQVLIPVVGLQ